MSLLLDALARASSEKEKLAGATPSPPATAPIEPPAEFHRPASRTPFPDLTIEPAPEPFFNPAPPVTKPVTPDPLEFIEPTRGGPGNKPTIELADTPSRDVEEPRIVASTPSIVPAALSMDPLDTPATASVVIPVTSVSPNPAALAKLSAELAGAEEAHIAPDPVPIEMAHEDATRSTAASKAEPTAQPVERPLSPQIAREILQATSKAPRRRPSRRVILLGVIALIGIAANGFFFFGFFDKFLGIPEPLYVPPPALDRSAVETAPPSVPVVTEAVATAPVSSALPTENPKAHEKPGKTAASTAPSSNRPVAETQTPTSEAKPVLLTERTGTPARIFTPKPVTTSALDSAYLLLTQGRLDEASTLYQQALAKNSAEIDALIGLAYVAQHQGRRDDARSFYQRVLRQQPSHPAAMAGVLEANTEGNPQASASRARELAERNPESAVALSTLGGMLAREGRIAEAQQAYFKAYTLEPTSGFHAFNLAVALDRLHKYAQAQQYYERALELAKAMPPGDQTHFPQAAATQRLEQLRGEGNGPLRDH